MHVEFYNEKLYGVLWTLNLLPLRFVIIIFFSIQQNDLYIRLTTKLILPTQIVDMILNCLHLKASYFILLLFILKNSQKNIVVIQRVIPV